MAGSNTCARRALHRQRLSGLPPVFFLAQRVAPEKDSIILPSSFFNQVEETPAPLDYSRLSNRSSLQGYMGEGWRGEVLLGERELNRPAAIQKKKGYFPERMAGRNMGQGAEGKMSEVWQLRQVRWTVKFSSWQERQV